MDATLAAGAKPAASWVPGAVVGRFTLLAKLAIGGMAEIWLARQGGLRGFEKVVVIKRILDAFSSDPSFVEMFLDEARIAAQLNHPNIVQVHDLGESAGAFYIAMEYLPGEHLAAVARAAIAAGAPLPPAMSVKLCVSALDGLAHAHGRVGVNGKPLNVVHRDVSPQNIVVTYDGQVKLVDFGIAKAATRSVQTQSGHLKGKFAYMAPEQAKPGSRVVDARADLFAVGVVLYELLSHKRLWGTDDQVEQLTALISPDAIPPLRERNPEVPEALEAIVMRALEKNPDRRWPSGTEFKDALEQWLRAQGGGPTMTEVAAMMHQRFEVRIARRAQLIEQANRGDLTPMGAGEVLKPPTERSMPGGTQAGGKGTVAIVFGMLALGGLLVGLAITLWARSQTPTVVEIPIGPTPVSVAAPAELTIQTEPSGAELFVDGSPAGTTLSPIEAGEHVVEAKLDGYAPIKRTVRIGGPGEKQTLVLSFVRLPAPVAAEPVKPVPARPATASAAKGRLTLSTDPWTHVSLGEKAIGDTPLVELPLPAGRHQLRLTNEAAKIDVKIEVEVKGGQLTKKVLKL